MPTFDEILEAVGGPVLTLELFLLVLTVLLIVVIGHKFPLRRLRAFDRRFHEFAANRARAVILVFVLALGCRVALLPFIGVPDPKIHDEFSYLLAADTFAHGRLTNPTPFGWEHFETMHVIVRPTYMSMYQPGQGLMLAAGVKLGHPWIAILIVTAAMCALLTWALQAWIPPGWALLGGILAVLRIGLVSYWVNSYWGGSLAALGGVLLLGAFGRWAKGPTWSQGIAAAIGVVILAATRPYEGLVLCAATGIVAIVLAARRGYLSLFLSRIAVPIVCFVVVFTAWLGYYNFRVTGSPTRLPYAIDLAEYAVAPRFLWQHPTSHTYRNGPMFTFYTGWEAWNYRQRRGWFGLYDKFRNQYRFFYAHLLTIPLAFGLSLVGHRRLRPLLLIGAISFLGFLPEVWLQSHYAAMLISVFYALPLLGMRKLRTWPSRHEPKGLLLIWAIPVIAVTALTARVAWNGSLLSQFPPYWDSWVGGVFTKKAVVDGLRGMGGEHLVVVHYQLAHNPHAEWVYNDGDIEHERIIWAREMNPASDAALIEHYGRGRSVWLLYADETPPRLEPYSRAMPEMKSAATRPEFPATPALARRSGRNPENEVPAAAPR